MKINFSQKLLNLYGETIVDEASKNPLTLSKVCVEALLANDRNENIDGVEKLRRFELAKAIHEGKKDSLSAEETVLLKELVAKYFSTLVVGQALPMLDSSD